HPCMHTCSYMYTHAHMRTHTHSCTLAHTCTHMHTCTHTLSCTHAHTCTPMHTCTHTLVYTCSTCTHTHTCTHTQVHTHTHRGTHAHTYSCTQGHTLKHTHTCTHTYSCTQGHMDWLSRYGYLPPPDPRTGQLQTKEGIEKALRVMQRFGGIKETGQLDSETLLLMKKPRCSLPDIIGTAELLRRRKRYALSGEVWSHTQLTWRVDNYPDAAQSPTLRADMVRYLMHLALQVWAKVTPLQFRELTAGGSASEEPDIHITFSSSYHQDGYPFDGPGGTLAHAFFPGEHPVSGDTHFDDQESWTYADPQGTDLFTVAIHEFGHALGLSHSSSTNSIMAPYYQGPVGRPENYVLPADDTQGIQQLYACLSPSVCLCPHLSVCQPACLHLSVSVSMCLSVRLPVSICLSLSSCLCLCVHLSVLTCSLASVLRDRDMKDTARASTQNSSSTLNNTQRKQSPSVCTRGRGRGAFLQYSVPVAILGHQDPHRPQVSVSCLTSLSPSPSLSGQYFWRIQRSGSLVSLSPALVSNFWQGLPARFARIDAVYERMTDSHIIFFIGAQYWVFKDTRALDGYPRPVSDWGLPAGGSRVTAAFVWAHNGKTYLFREKEFWRYDDREGRVDPGYPKSASLWSGVPSDPDDIITWEDGDAYFFKDNQYWVQQKGGLNQEATTPRSVAVDWMRCAPPPSPSQPPVRSDPKGRDCICNLGNGGVGQTPKVVSHWLFLLPVSLLAHLTSFFCY
ncbi:MMP25 protein, partial [Atractosteus spatula]|nr:MMP25 protein [Atractosteus spatula]